MKKRLFFLPLFASVLAFAAFVRSDGADSVRAVQMVSLIATGMAAHEDLATFGVSDRQARRAIVMRRAACHPAATSSMGLGESV